MLSFECVTEHEARVMYRQAKNKNDILQVLADLMLSTKEEVAELLDAEEGIRKHKKIKRKVYLDTARCLEMYTAGATDKELVQGLGVSQSTISKWRQRNHLPPNGHGLRPMNM